MRSCRRRGRVDSVNLRSLQYAGFPHTTDAAQLQAPPTAPGVAPGGDAGLAAAAGPERLRPPRHPHAVVALLRREAARGDRGAGHGDASRGPRGRPRASPVPSAERDRRARPHHAARDRKSTRLNSSHANISYAVFCLKKKKISKRDTVHTAAGTLSRLDLSVG